MGRYGALWGSTDQVLVEQDVLLCYGMAMGPYAVLWGPMGFCGVLRVLWGPMGSMGFYGALWGAMGQH